MVSFDSNLRQLGNLIYDIKNEQKREAELVINIEDILQNFSTYLSIKNSIPNGLKNRAIDLLLSLGELVEAKFDSGKIQKISLGILQIQSKLIDITKLRNPKNNFKIDLLITLYLNIFIPDRNGAFSESFRGILKENGPIITTRSIVQANDVHECNLSLLKRQQVQNELLILQENWDIYQLRSCNEILLFLPKSLLSEKQGLEKLKALDFISDPKEIKKISVHEIFKPYEGKNSGGLMSFYRLFVNTPKLNKAFHLGGHGNNQSIGSLYLNEYQEFLTFLDQQNCKVLVIDSCQSGGIASLQNISYISSMHQENDPQILTLAHSFSDAFSIGQDLVDKHAAKTLREIASCWEKGAVRETTIKKLFNSIDKLPYKYTFNLAKVLLPYSSRVSAGFRPVCEKYWVHSITYADCQRALLQSQRHFSMVSDSNEYLSIVNKKIVSIHPIIIECPITFRKCNPQMVSMIPGQASHFFREIILSGAPIEFFKKTAINQSKNLQVNKSFFIENLYSSQGIYEQVVIFTFPNSFFWGYKEDNEFHINYNHTQKKVSELEFAMFWQNALNMSYSDENAVKSATGGHQTYEMFLRNIRQSLFETTLSQKTQDLLILASDYQDSDCDTVFKKTSLLSINDLKAILFLLFRWRHFSIAFELIKHYKVDVNSVSVDGIPLICAVIHTQSIPMINYMIKKKVDMNVSDPYSKNNSALHLLVNYELYDSIALLKCSNIKLDLNVKNLYGLTPLGKAVCLVSSKIFTLLLKINPLINEVIENETLLGVSVRNISSRNNNHTRALDRLIEAKADPNLGNPSALIQAIEGQNFGIIKKLLEAGGKPFEKDIGGSIPFIQAILKGNYPTIMMLLNHPDCRLDIADDREISPLIAALVTKNKKVLQALENKQVSFPTSFSRSLSQLCIKNLLLDLYVHNDAAGLKQLFAWRRLPCPQFDDMVIEIFIQKPDLLAECIKEGLINLNQKS